MLDDKKLVVYLKKLISIPSYDSAGMVADYIIKELCKEGLKPKKDRYGNVLLEMGAGKGFLLNAHMDTVGVDGWEETALNPTIKNGRLYGRGSSDTKSGVATMMAMAVALKQSKLKRKIIFVFSINEEDSSLEENGAYLASSYINAKEGIILEPSFKDRTLSMGVGCKGAYRFEITIQGKSCHSSVPEKGINALYLANDFINDFKKLRPEKGTYNVMGKKVSMKSVFTVTQIKAEEGTNVIPGRCTLSIDYRALPQEKSAEVKRKINRLCKKHFYNGFTIKERCIDGYFAYDASFIRNAEAVIRKHGLKPVVVIKHSRNDCCIFSNYAHVKSICLGTGESGQAHIVGESVQVSGFLKSSKVIFDIVKKICT